MIRLPGLMLLLTSVTASDECSVSDTCAEETTLLQFQTAGMNMKAGRSGANMDASASDHEHSCTGTFEAESATIVGGVVHGGSMRHHAGFSGDSFVDYLHPSGDYVEWSVPSCSGGFASLSFRYALAGGNRPLQVLVNGAEVAPRLSFPRTGSWSTWGEVPTPLVVELNAGTNVIKLVATGRSGANMDALIVGSTSRCMDGSVKAADSSGQVLTSILPSTRHPSDPPGTPFYPWVSYQSSWYPICGHYFWDNNDGATLICQQLGFDAGTLTRSNTPFPVVAMHPGRCSDSDESLTSCSLGANYWQDPLTHRNSQHCAAGTRASVMVTCSLSDGGSRDTTGSPRNSDGLRCA